MIPTTQQLQITGFYFLINMPHISTCLSRNKHHSHTTPIQIPAGTVLCLCFSPVAVSEEQWSLQIASCCFLLHISGCGVCPPPPHMKLIGSVRHCFGFHDVFLSLSNSFSVDTSSVVFWFLVGLIVRPSRGRGISQIPDHFPLILLLSTL